ncbi:hypothetical protein K1T71_006261 [Dendrolimus kikuchii]|uniref:Uncharacterized protein n=1 Tax=Dendrolimus kikuchii TaxID=765133 RepID=A0ACC1D4B6_9NEOP|nr:hypothetical protein K1T71_006261 [Dendrolimus kikuchii]
MILQIIFTLVLLTVNGNEIRPRVIAGQDAELELYPFIVMLIAHRERPNPTVKRMKTCTASLISEQWVIAAAHCYGKWIRYANTTVPFEDDTMFIEIIKDVAFQGYHNRGFLGFGKWQHVTSLNDIKMFKLRDRASVKSFGKLSAVDYKTLIGKPAVTIGFGYTYIVAITSNVYKFNWNRTAANLSMPLQYADTVVSKCQKFKTFGPSICVAATCKNRHTAAMFGDSGGPLLVDNMIVGVASFAYIATSAAYAPISPYLNWILSVEKSLFMFLTILSYTISFLTATHASDIRPRVIAGQDAEIDHYPLEDHERPDRTVERMRGCTASLISEQWVIAAAHCYGKWIRYANTTVPFEDHTMFIEIIKDVPFQDYNAHGFLGLGKWHHVTNKNDIKLLKLRDRASVKSFGKLSAVDYKALIGKPAVTLGFGYTCIVAMTSNLVKFNYNRTAANLSLPLQYADTIVSKCQKFKTFGPNICVAATCKNRHTALMFGDSGRPLLVDNMIVGVASFTYIATSAV